MRYGTVAAVRDVSLQRRPGRDRRADRPERRRQVDDAARDHGRSSRRTPARSGCAGARSRGRSPESIAQRGRRARARRPADLRRLHGRGEPATRARGQPRPATGGDPLARAYDLFPMLKEFRRRSGRRALGRTAAAAGDRAGARGRPGRAAARRAVARPRAACGRRASSRRCAGSASGASTILLVEQRALHTVALADRTHVLVGGRAASDPRAPPTPRTPTRSSPPTSPRDPRRPPLPRLPDPLRRGRAGRDLRADGGRDRARLRRAATRQLRLRPAGDGRRVHAGLHLGLADVARASSPASASSSRSRWRWTWSSSGLCAASRRR